jgi:replicative DNA helicase
MNTVEAKLKTLTQMMDAQVVVLDYIEPLAPVVRRKNDYRIEVKEKVSGYKRLLSDLGLVGIGGHQISRKGREDAEKRGFYILSDLGESSGVEQNASNVVWSLYTEDMEMNSEMRWGTMKGRRSRRTFRKDVKCTLDRGRIWFERGVDDEIEEEDDGGLGIE